jgi:integrase
VPAAQARPLLRQGIDPIEHRKAAAWSRTGSGRRRALTAANRSAWRSAKHEREWLRSLHRYFAPILAMPVNKVERQDIVRALQRLESVFDWAGAAGFCTGPNPARWSGGMEHLLPRTKTVVDTRHAALPYVELPNFMAKLRAADRADARALEFLILSVARTNEVRLAAWSELDVANAIWVVPAERMKAGKEHRVPLSVPALQVLAQLPRTHGLVFPGPRSGGAMSAAALLRLLGRLGYPDITVLGFRSAFHSWAGEATNFPREVAEQALAHSVGNAVEQAYQRGDLLEKRRRLMEAWGQYLARPTSAGMVTPIRRGDRHA